MKKGFTLIEVLVVAVIVAVLAAVAIPAYNGYIKDSRNNVAENLAATVASSLATYYSQNTGATPGNISLAEIKLKLPDGYTATAGTITNTAGAVSWDGTDVQVVDKTDAACSATISWH